MRKLARLVLFFSVSFVVLFLVMAGARFLVLRLEWVRALSWQADFIAAARWALSLALYGGILLGLIYTVREKFFPPMVTLCMVLLSLGFAAGIGRGLENWSNLVPDTLANRDQALGAPGLILANQPFGTAVILLQGPDEPSRARIVAVPDSPMIFQEEFAGLAESLPPAPFNSDTPWFLQSVAIDIRLNAENLQQRLVEGMPSFLLYVGSLVFLLSSLMFVIRFGVWPLANFFLGILAFRGVLALETLFNSREMQDVFASFLQDRLPVSIVVPVIFLVAGLIANLYSILTHLARRQGRDAVV
ncbi:MAG: hypothetical protein FWB78_02760 [Treponema sp.]|nr:hypothetical protein [Treponema sp.]